MAGKSGKLTVNDVPRLLETLTCGDADAQRQTLGLLCPCRNRVYDRDVWLEIFHIYDRAGVAATVRGEKAFETVRHQAEHAIDTLRELARTDERARELMQWLVEQGVDPDAREKRQMPKQEEKITSRDIPRLLESLDCDNPQAKQHTLHLLCPCRNVRYDKEVWLAIFRTFATTDDRVVRDQAGHAIGTLRTRARNDPRSQELVQWLTEQGVQVPGLQEAVPVWQPNLRGDGLYIPRFEHSSRSKTNRRRR
jgi:hypothetical protein